MAITVMPKDQQLYTIGTRLLLTCSVQIDTAVDTPVMMDAEWVGPLGPVHNDSWNSIISSQTISGLNTSLSMVLLNITASSFYQCIWYISSSNPNVGSTANISRFQLITTGNNFRSTSACSK